MVDLFSTPSLVTIILGAVALFIPVIDALNKEKGSRNKIYSAISFGALALSLIIVIVRIVLGETIPALSLANTGVLTDDVFGGFFSIAFIIVSIIVTVSSFIKYRDDFNWLFY
jgi:hypothetical protein